MYTNVDASLLVFYSIKIMASVIIIGIPLRLTLLSYLKNSTARAKGVRKLSNVRRHSLQTQFSKAIEF